MSQDLDLQIENPRRELKGADFPCDIVANLVGDEERIVVIENQFGRTNHDHLAKLITYAATHNAMIGIWIAEEVADDHRQVIDWLNKNTPDTVGLYLAETQSLHDWREPAGAAAGSGLSAQLDDEARKRRRNGRRERAPRTPDFLLAGHSAAHEEGEAPFPTSEAGARPLVQHCYRSSRVPPQHAPNP